MSRDTIDTAPLGRARTLADEVLEPHAADAADPARGVRREHLELLATEGLMTVRVPVVEGGAGLDALTDFEVSEAVAAGCRSTWFVMAQHRMPQTVAAGGIPGVAAEVFSPGAGLGVHGPDIRAARERCGISVNHLRRFERPAARARRDASGYRLDGQVRWVTGWGLVDSVMIGAYTPDDRVLLCLVASRAAPGLSVEEPALSVMGGTRTVSLGFSDLFVPDDDVLCVVDGPAYRAATATGMANVAPATTGMLRRLLRALGGLPAGAALAARYGERVEELRAEALALLTQVPPDERVAERLALRAELGALAVTVSGALVAARGGSAFLAESPEQRWAREAAFLLVVGQSSTLREAQLAAFGAGVP